MTCLTDRYHEYPLRLIFFVNREVWVAPWQPRDDRPLIPDLTQGLRRRRGTANRNSFRVATNYTGKVVSGLPERNPGLEFERLLANGFDHDRIRPPIPENSKNNNVRSQSVSDLDCPSHFQKEGVNNDQG